MSDIRSRILTPLDRVAQVVSDAGGEIVGRTKLQKTTYLLSLAGFESGFRFSYKHYGPFSEELAEASELAAAFGVIAEAKSQASWGGTYSVYSAKKEKTSDLPARVRLAQEAAHSDAVLLELAATAAYLAHEGEPDPWSETQRRKPDKAANGRLIQARELYSRLRAASKDALPVVP